jgi:hypothetical protein
MMVSFHIWLSIYILVYNQKQEKSQNKFQWTTKHVFWQNYFMHMWLAPKVEHFEPIEHNFMSNNFLNESFSSHPFLLKFQNP